MGYLQGDWIPHPNSLLFNAFPPFWGLKVFWFFRKVSRTARIIPPNPASAELTAKIVFSVDGSTLAAPGLPKASWGPRWRKETSQLLHLLAPPLSTTKIATHRQCCATISLSVTSSRTVKTLLEISKNILKPDRLSPTQRARPAHSSHTIQMPPRPGYLKVLNLQTKTRLFLSNW